MHTHTQESAAAGPLLALLALDWLLLLRCGDVHPHPGPPKKRSVPPAASGGGGGGSGGGDDDAGRSTTCHALKASLAGGTRAVRMAQHDVNVYVNFANCWRFHGMHALKWCLGVACGLAIQPPQQPPPQQQHQQQPQQQEEQQQHHHHQPPQQQQPPQQPQLSSDARFLQALLHEHGIAILLRQMVVYDVQRSRAQRSDHAALLHAYGQRCGWQRLTAPAELDDSQIVRCAAGQLARQLHANLARMLAEPVLPGFVTHTMQLVRACCCPRRPCMCVYA
jgi:hypothetical protein